MGRKKKQKYDIVPFQLCCKCNGTGTIITYSVSTTAYCTTTVCDVCHGAMVIPQALIPVKE